MMNDFSDELLGVMNYGTDCKLYRMYKCNVKRLEKGIKVQYNLCLKENSFPGFIHSQNNPLFNEFDFVDNKLLEKRLIEFNTYFNNPIEFIDRTISGSYKLQDCHTNYFLHLLHQSYNGKEGKNLLPLVPITENDIFEFEIYHSEECSLKGTDKAINIYQFLLNTKGNELNIRLVEKSQEHEDYIYALKRLNLAGMEYNIRCNEFFENYYNVIIAHMSDPHHQVLIKNYETINQIKNLYENSKAIESKMILIMYLNACFTYKKSLDNIFAAQTQTFLRQFVGNHKLVESKMIQGVTKLISFIEKI